MGWVMGVRKGYIQMNGTTCSKDRPFQGRTHKLLQEKWGVGEHKKKKSPAWPQAPLVCF